MSITFINMQRFALASATALLAPDWRSGGEFRAIRDASRAQ